MTMILILVSLDLFVVIVIWILPAKLHSHLRVVKLETKPTMEVFYSKGCSTVRLRQWQMAKLWEHCWGDGYICISSK